MDGPLVSVVLPTRDRASSVGRAVESVLAQTYRPLELLVVDDGSRDDTRSVLHAYDPEITVLAQGRRGVYEARNLALRHAAGELVAFIDSDDAWLPHRLASQVPLLDRPEVGLVFGDAVHVRPGVGPAHRTRTCFDTTPPGRGRVAGQFVRGNFVPTITVLVRRACLEQVGAFPTSHDVSADALTWFRIALRHELDFVPEVVAEYTVHEHGISWDLGRALQARIELFSEELSRTADAEVRTVLRQLVFSLALSLELAAARGRATSVPHAWRRAAQALRVASPMEATRWTAAFVVHQASARAARGRRQVA